MAFSGYQDFRPDFGTAMQRFIAANPGISINSGYRTPERQAELYRAAVQKYGPDRAGHYVGKPGGSYHNKRLAADLGYKDDAARQWAHAHAQDFGLVFPLGHEDWHVELAGARSGATPADPSDNSVGDTASVLANATDPNKPLYDLSSLGASAAKRQAELGGPVKIWETPRRPETPLLEVPLVSALDNQVETRNTVSPLSPLSPLADLFQVKAIGQAGTPKDSRQEILMADDLAALLAGATRPDNSAPPPGLPNALYYIPREWWRGEGGGPSYLRPPSGIKSGTAPFSPPSFPLGTRYPPPPPPSGVPGGHEIKRRPLPYNMQQMLDEMPDIKLKDEYQQGRAV